MITWRQLREKLNVLPEEWLDIPVAVERDIDAGEFIRAISLEINKNNVMLRVNEPYIKTAEQPK